MATTLLYPPKSIAATWPIVSREHKGWVYVAEGDYEGVFGFVSFDPETAYDIHLTVQLEEPFEGLYPSLPHFVLKIPTPEYTDHRMLQLPKTQMVGIGMESIHRQFPYDTVDLRYKYHDTWFYEDFFVNRVWDNRHSYCGNYMRRSSWRSNGPPKTTTTHHRLGKRRSNRKYQGTTHMPAAIHADWSLWNNNNNNNNNLNDGDYEEEDIYGQPPPLMPASASHSPDSVDDDAATVVDTIHWGKTDPFDTDVL